MKHRILTPIVAMGGVGGVTTPIVLNTTGVAQTSSVSSSTAQSSELKVVEQGSGEARSSLDENIPNRQVTVKQKRTISSLFL